uniref:Uncharacterized protein n=1 Tax=Arundo donax TaxID=35708 RepID=A0A0A9H853_ARUDO
MSSSGCTPMDLPSSASSGSTSVVAASSEVNSVMTALKTQATGAMTSAGAPFRNPSPSERMSVRPLALNPSAMAKPAPRSRMMCHCSFRHLPQSMSLSPSFLPLGMMNSSVAIMMVTVPSPTLPSKRTPHPGMSSVRLLVIHRTMRPPNTAKIIFSANAIGPNKLSSLLRWLLSR